MEEINLNYKDEASLESGSGTSTEGREGGENSHYSSPSLCIGRHFLFLFFFFSFFPLSCGNEVACHPSSLACHPDTPPSLTHAQASYQLVSSGAVAGVDRTAGTTQSPLSSSCSLLTDNRCLGFSGNARLFAGLSQPLRQNQKNLFPCLQTCNIPEL